MTNTCKYDHAYHATFKGSFISYRLHPNYIFVPYRTYRSRARISLIDIHQKRRNKWAYHQKLTNIEYMSFSDQSQQGGTDSNISTLHSKVLDIYKSVQILTFFLLRMNFPFCFFKASNNMTAFIEKVCINFQPSLLNISVLARKIEFCWHVKGLKFHTISFILVSY